MPDTDLSFPYPFPAGQRTVLLHQMLVVRHLAERRTAVPYPNLDDVAVDFHVGEEAAAAGVLAGPVEALVVRMFAAHQLDENALRAIDAHAVAQVAAMTAAPSGGSC